MTMCVLPLDFYMGACIQGTKQDTLFADYAPGRKVLQQRLVDLSRSVLFACNDYPISSLERIQALALFAMYQWVSSLSCLNSSTNLSHRTKRMWAKVGTSLDSPFGWHKHVWYPK